MISFKINGIDFLSKPSISILEACKNVGITIPRFCYQEMLSISGNCRMCLVEIENMEKPVASCVTEIEENMSIQVDSCFVKKARENVLEALLINHPLDCPICDQAGECDLQDQTKAFGNNHTRYFFEKKTSEDKYCGPLIKTIMTRCIKCTRCVRYAEEITGINYFGTLNRGVETEIGSYVTKVFESEISGNVIDLCPVGALTSKPYAFKARPWELRLAESFDTTDSLGSNVYVNFKESEILRVLPKNNFEINESLLTDKGRYSYDSNLINRIKNVYHYNFLTKNYEGTTWKSLLSNIDVKIKNRPISILLNQEIDLESVISFKKFKNKLSEVVKVEDADTIYNSNNIYIANQTNSISKLDKIEDVSIFLGSNLRLENALLNARVRFKYRDTFLYNFVLGNTFDTNIPSKFINLNIKNLVKVFEGHCCLVSKVINNSISCHIFIGNGLSNRVCSLDNFLDSLKLTFHNIILLRIYASSNSDALKWVNIRKNSFNNLSSLIAINSKENFLTKNLIKNFKEKSIFLGTHGTSSALGFEVILPIKSVFEDSKTFLNMEHRSQRTAPVLNVVAESRSISSIFNALFSLFNYKNLWMSHVEESVSFPEKYSTLKNVCFINKFFINKKFISLKTKMYKYPIKQTIKNFYLSSRMCVYSKTMQECSKELYVNYSNFIKKNKK